MAYTETDLTNIETAIVSLASGSAVVRVSIGDKTIEYSQAKLSELRRTAEYIRRELGLSTAPKYYKTITGPGYG